MSAPPRAPRGPASPRYRGRMEAALERLKEAQKRAKTILDMIRDHEEKIKKIKGNYRHRKGPIPGADGATMKRLEAGSRNSRKANSRVKSRG